MNLQFAQGAYKESFRDGLKPDKIYTVSEWADEFRILSTESSAESGPWRTERTPYLKEIMDCLSNDSPYQKVTFMKASQIGGSECGLNWLGYIMHHAPAPVIAVQPNITLAKRFSKQRVDPLINGSPVLRDKIGPSSKKESQNTILEKNFPGGMLVLAGANAAAGLRSMPARDVFLDEIDGYPIDLNGEGDPCDLATARSRTFHKRKWFFNSSPTIDGISRIQISFDESDRRFCHLPCPDCGHYQKLVFENLRWDTEFNHEGKKIPTNVRYQCDACDYPIRNWQKTKMLANLKWVPENPDAENGRHAGFHLSSLYSPVGWYSWEDIAEDFLKKKDIPEKLKTFVNTVLGETWKEKTETPPWKLLYERRENYTIGIVPENVAFLTAGCDVQEDRIEIEIVGWCEHKISYSVEYLVLYGKTNENEVWDKLTELIYRTWPLQSCPQLSMGLKAVGIDSSYRTQIVYDYVRSLKTIRVMALKGQDELQMIAGNANKRDITIKGNLIRRGLKVWPVGSSVAKVELYGFLGLDKALPGEPDKPGYCHFPEYEPEYFKMLTAEKLVYKIVKGYKKGEWIKTRERNESLDCRVYARAVAAIIGMDRFTSQKWTKMKENLKGIEKKNERPK